MPGGLGTQNYGVGGLGADSSGGGGGGGTSNTSGGVAVSSISSVGGPKLLTHEIEDLKNVSPLAYRGVKKIVAKVNQTTAALMLGKTTIPAAPTFKKVTAGSGVVTVILDSGNTKGLMFNHVEISTDPNFGAAGTDEYPIGAGMAVSAFVGVGATVYVRARMKFLQSGFSDYTNFGSITA